jgi:hypothetical protein
MTAIEGLKYIMEVVNPGKNKQLMGLEQKQWLLAQL